MKKRMIRTLLCQVALLLTYSVSQAQIDSTVQLKWLGAKTPAMATGVSWGVPFKKGVVQPESDYMLKDSNGTSMMVQSWPMAYWPDGSIKWVGLSTVAGPENSSTFQLQANSTSKKTTGQIQVTESEESVQINTGVLQCDIPRRG